MVTSTDSYSEMYNVPSPNPDDTRIKLLQVLVKVAQFPSILVKMLPPQKEPHH